VQPAIWAAAHITQFSEPGWIFIDGGCGFIYGGSYITLQNPVTGDFSIIIETMDATEPQQKTFRLSDGSGNKMLRVWTSTKGKDEFVRLKDLDIKNKLFTLDIRGKSVYSITSTSGQMKGSFRAPAISPFPMPYSSTFENDTEGQLPRYFQDQAGVFEVHRRRDGKGNCIKQVMTQQGTEWGSSNTFVGSVIGDTAWTDYSVSVDVNILENTGYALIMGRLTEMNRGSGPPSGYWLKVIDSYKCELYAGEIKIASAESKTGISSFTWHNLKLVFKGQNIRVLIDNSELINIANNRYTHGLAGIGCGYNLTEFDNFEIR
jgi:galactosylceramidase